MSDPLVQQEIQGILQVMSPEDRAALLALPETDLIYLHHTLGRFLRNGLRGNQFPQLLGHSHALVKANGTPMSFDALSTVAIREIWRTLRQDKAQPDAQAGS
jgi:hypothetical protein